MMTSANSLSVRSRGTYKSNLNYPVVLLLLIVLVIITLQEQLEHQNDGMV
jgi:hypothetical protein